MVRKLNVKDKKIVLDFAYSQEMENLFIIGSFNNYKNTFKSNQFWGYFENEKLLGLAVYFKRFGNFVVNAENRKTIYELVDFAINDKIKIKNTAIFEKYGKTLLQILKKKHGIIPKQVSKETVFVLEKKNFKDFSTGKEKNASKKDVDDLVVFTTGKKPNKIEREKIFYKQEFILREKSEIISKANIHGLSKNYFQIGGVGTKEEHRGKGYAKQVVSSLCKHYFDKGIAFGLLFTANDNFSAQKVYKSIGFKKKDKFLIAQF